MKIGDSRLISSVSNETAFKHSVHSFSFYWRRVPTDIHWAKWSFIYFSFASSDYWYQQQDAWDPSVWLWNTIFFFPWRKTIFPHLHIAAQILKCSSEHFENKKWETWKQVTGKCKQKKCARENCLLGLSVLSFCLDLAFVYVNYDCWW